MVEKWTGSKNDICQKIKHLYICMLVNKETIDEAVKMHFNLNFIIFL